MGDEKIKEKNLKGFCRYKNIETFEFIKYFRENKRFLYKLKDLDLSLKNNICYFNKTRINGNKKFSENFKIGDKVILKENYEKFGMFKIMNLLLKKLLMELLMICLKLETLN